MLTVGGFPASVFAPVVSLSFFFVFFFSLSLSLSVALVLALALARFVPVTEGAWARVPPNLLAHGANRTGIFKTKPSCGGVSLAYALCCV